METVNVSFFIFFLENYEQYFTFFSIKHIAYLDVFLRRFNSALIKGALERP